MFRALLASLASLFTAKPEPVPARRIKSVVVSAEDRAMACEWGGRNYWRG